MSYVLIFMIKYCFRSFCKKTDVVLLNFFSLVFSSRMCAAGLKTIFQQRKLQKVRVEIIWEDSEEEFYSFHGFWCNVKFV